MFSAAELIDALRRRTRRSLRPERPAGEFPEGWSAWFAVMGQRIGAVTGASADAIIAVFLQREPALPPRSAADLNRWQAFATLWRQQWQAPEPDERRIRLVAIAITLFVHLFLVLVLLWLAYVRFVAVPAPSGEDVVQVEYVGQGTPQEQGGGAPQEEAPRPTPPAPVAQAAPTPTRSRPQPQQAAQPVPALPSPAQPPQPTTPTPVGEQPLQVSEPRNPEATFVLPPPTPRRAAVPQPEVTVPQLRVPARDVELVEAPPPVRALEPALPTAAIPAPRLKTSPVPVEVIEPLPEVQRREVEVGTLAIPAPRTTAPPVQLQQAPSPTPSNAAASAPVPQQAGRASTAVAPSVSGRPVPGSGTRPAAAATGSGPASTAKPGAWPTPERGDDWGISTRNQPGGNAGQAPGLLNGDGTPRLANGTAQAGGGFPPGSDNWTRDQIDRAGTWLKRPPNDYTPTRFDQYWLPSGTLLEEWVRRGIREIAIPIPGTTKKIQCVVSILQLGGGCGVSDPNLNDQEAIARPPPDIPFKPELQEDQDSLRKPANP